MDETLLRRAQQGEPEAFEMLMTDHLESLVWRVCWHYTGKREDADDCGQEAILKIWRSLPTFRFDCAFESWVYRIAANVCLDFLRKRKKENVTSLEPLTEHGFDPPDPGPDPEEQAIRNADRENLRQAISALPEDQRDALILTQLEGESYAKAALLLGTNEGTVKSRVNRARIRLKECLKNPEELFPEVSVQMKERRDRS